MGMQSETLCEMTAVELAQITGRTVDLFRMKWAKLKREGSPLFASDFDRNATLTVDQIIALRPEMAGVKNISEVPSVVPMRPKAARPNEVAPQAGTIDVSIEREKAFNTANWEFIKRAHKDRLAKKASEIYTVKKAPLWATLVLTAGASVPNMFEVTFAIKHDALLSCFLTGALTFAPFLLIMSKIRGVFPMFVVLSVMVYTGFCNATSIFGGLTALDIGYILKPTVFLEAVTNLLNTDYLNTARGLSGLMALLIGAIEFVSFKNIAK